MGRPLRSAAVVLALIVAASCATKAPVPVAGAPKHPDFLFPAAPEGTPAALAARLDAGWRYLQLDDLRSAEREFSAALKTQASFYPAEAAMGYIALVRENPRDAVTRFEHALQGNASYVPALVGRGQALLEQSLDNEALASFELALATDPSLIDLRGRVDVLRVRAMQGQLTRAKAAADAGRLDEARTAYEQAIAASPDSAFLYRDLAAVEQKAGQPTLALEHFRTAVHMDSGDAHSLAAIGAILEAQDDVVGALSAYERARALDPSEVPDAVLTRIRTRAALARLPPQYRAIPSAPGVTRADIAALVGNRLEALVARTRPRQVIITDIRGQWAQAWINAVVRAGIMDTLPNYQFDPAGRVRRGDLALTVSRILTLIAAQKPEAGKKWIGARVQVADVSASHLSYPAVSAAVASGVMSLTGGAFDLLRGVTGAEALDAVGRLEALARP